MKIMTANHGPISALIISITLSCIDLGANIFIVLGVNGLNCWVPFNILWKSDVGADVEPLLTMFQCTSQKTKLEACIVGNISR